MASPSLIDRVSADAHRILVGGSRGLEAGRDEVLSTPRDDTVTIVLRGVGASRSTTADGERFIDALLGPGEAHGLTAALGHPEVATELFAVTPVQALVIPGHVLRGLIRSTPAVATACLEVIAEDHATSRGDQARLTGSSAPGRVEHRLIELAERYGVVDGTRVIVMLPLTQESLASWARTSRESCAKALHDLRHAGIVTTGRRELIVEDLAALRARRRRSAPDPSITSLLHRIG